MGFLNRESVRRVFERTDWLLEGSGFELSVPLAHLPQTRPSAGSSSISTPAFPRLSAAPFDLAAAMGPSTCCGRRIRHAAACLPAKITSRIIPFGRSCTTAISTTTGSLQIDNFATPAALDGYFHTRDCGAAPWVKRWNAGGTSASRAGRRQRGGLVDRAVHLLHRDERRQADTHDARRISHERHGGRRCRVGIVCNDYRVILAIGG
jgi:hypothetical protein